MSIMSKWKRSIISTLGLFIFFTSQAQLQTCPANINFAAGDLSFWSAQTGLVNGSVQTYPLPNNGLSSIPEYSITTTGVRVITNPTNDPFGSFPTVPTINGYAYNYSIQLGSSSTSWDLHASIPNPGGFTRAVSYAIHVPAGPITVPYTMTYAYAMVLENGTHNSNQQPLFKATLQTADSVITCASPQYYLPTFDDAGNGSTGATLDTAAALANGFHLSPVFFLSHAGQNNSNGTLLQDVWTKGWTEVTFDLSPYRGQTVTLTFESLNCTPGAHFAYAYVALRNTCAGLEISGNPQACANTSVTYSVPSLAGGIYHWTVPSGWVITSGANTNTITVTAGSNSGIITIQELNGCADLRDTINVTASPPTVPGQVTSNNTVCSGNNSTLLNLNGEVGNIIGWIYSTNNGASWSPIPNVTTSYLAQNLTTTTQFSALVQNGSACKVDTSQSAIITVDPKSVGGVLAPANINVCLGETTNNTITLTGSTGQVQNWQQSFNSTNWTAFNPVKTDLSYTTNSVSQTTYYRTIVKSGVCPADTSTIAKITFIPVPFPQASINPPNAAICYGKTTPINAVINLGTSYSWSNPGSLTNQGNGVVSAVPTIINATAAPPRTMDYVLTVNNAGCPNPLRDTFHVDVSPRIIVFAGNDTAVVANQPLQLHATANQPTANIFSWRPSTGLNFTNIYNPIATLDPSMGQSIMYIVRATDANGCYGEDNIIVTIFSTGPDMFIPKAFTPNGDGLNETIYPICVGIRQLNYFRIYNRWGQLVFSTSEIGKGWDGKINGAVQTTNNYVYVAEAVDYTGKVLFRKGNVTLIR